MADYSFEEQQSITKQMSDKIYNDSYTTTEEELVKDVNWIQASKDVYKQLEGVEWSGSDEDAAKKGLDMMGRFNYNLTLGTINYTAQLQDAPDQTKLSFYYLMDMYDKKDISGNGVLRAFKEMGLDPASYIGIGTLGMGFVGKQAAAATAKTGLKAMLKQGAIRFLQSPTAVAATEGAIYTTADDIARQDAAIGAGVQDEYSPGQTAIAAGVGGTVGGAIGNVLPKLTTSISNVFTPKKQLPTSLNTAPAPASLIQAASSGDKDAYDTLAKEVFGRTFEMIANKNTGDQLKPMILDKLVENPNIVEELASKFGFNIKYFSSDPENVGRAIGSTKVEERPATRSKLQKQGYSAGNIWVYDPYDTHGSFNDPEYTKAWRGIHELAHAITERVMEAKYGPSRRFGALGIDTKNPYDPNDPRTYKALTAEEAQRAIEWEDVAFRTQLKLLDSLGIKVDKQQAVNDFNIAGSDTVLRTLTGDFSDPADYGVLPRTDEYRIDVKQVLELLQNQENELAKAQGREPTQGIDLQKWEHVSDDELETIINTNLETPLKQPTANDNLLMSIEAVPGASVDIESKKIIQSLPYKEQEKYLQDIHTSLTDQAGHSIIAKKLGLDVGKGSYTTGVWMGETNPVLQLEIKPEFDNKGNLTPEFKTKLDDMAEMYAVALKQDGVGWNMPHYSSSSLESQNAIEFKTGKVVDKNIVSDISNKVGDIAAIVSTKDGIRFLNISDLSNTEFINKIEKELQNIETHGDVIYFTSDSNFVQGVTNDRQQKNSLSRRSDLQEWFNSNIIKQTERVNQRYSAKARRVQTKD